MFKEEGDCKTTMKTKRLDPIQYLTGFLMGAFFGFVAEGILLALSGLLFTWFGWTRPEFTWWMPVLLIPIPLVFGRAMGRAIASMHLEDY